MEKKARSKQNDKKTNAGVQKAAAFCKRYWYWLVAVPVLIAGICVWCYFMGFFDKKDTIVSATDSIELYVGFSYRLNATSNAGEVTYAMEEKYGEYFTLENGVLHGERNGSGYITLAAGNAKKIVYVTVTTVTYDWKVRVGDKIPMELVVDTVEAVRSGGINTMLSNGEILEACYDEGDEHYLALAEGECELLYMLEDGTPVCDFLITITADLPEEERDTHTEIRYLSDYAIETIEKDRKIVGETIMPNLGDFAPLEKRAFASEGNVFYYSSAPDVVRVTQEGEYWTLSTGTAYITAVCLDPSGETMEYYTYKFRIPPLETGVYLTTESGEPRPWRVGEKVTTELLRSFFAGDNVVSYRTDYGAFLRETEDGSFECVKETGESVIYVDGYDDRNKQIVRYSLQIQQEPTGGEEDE